jgi:hypothetical protein
MASTDLLKFDPAAITNDPAYQFQRTQGLDAINSQAAASGELNSGGAMAGAAQFGQGLATDFTNQQFQRNMGRFQAQNQAQGQLFGQGLNAQGQTFQQGSQLTNLLAMISGATQSPALGSQTAFGQQQTNYGNILGGLGGLSRQNYGGLGNWWDQSFGRYSGGAGNYDPGGYTGSGSWNPDN